jgi:hypothetical protein
MTVLKFTSVLTTRDDKQLILHNSIDVFLETPTLPRMGSSEAAHDGATQSATTSLDDTEKPPPGLSRSRRRMYSKDHLEAYELLDSPIWVFDIDNKSMWWANEAACYLWSATDCESLVQRDFASDMSKATEHSLNNWLERFALGYTNKDTVRSLSGLLCVIKLFTVIVIVIAFAI